MNGIIMQKMLESYFLNNFIKNDFIQDLISKRLFQK